MGAKVITIGLQKGGVHKSTTTGVLAYMLSEDGYKVLVVDMDTQGNVSELLSGKEVDEFLNNTILEGIIDQNVEPYILEINDNLHLVPADDYLALLARTLYISEHASKWKGRTTFALKDAIDPVREKYDFILIDTPPSLAEPMTNSITASDYVLIMAKSESWALTAVPRFMETVEYVHDELNPDTSILGILRVKNDPTGKRTDSKAILEVIAEMWPEHVFKTVIRHTAATGRISAEGLYNNKELRSALEDYRDFYKELMNRVQSI